MNFSIPIGQQPNGVYVPNNAGPGVCGISVTQEPNSTKTAIIHFAGCNQAVVNYNEMGQAINYTILMPSVPLSVIVSVENIIAHIAGHMSAGTMPLVLGS